MTDLAAARAPDQSAKALAVLVFGASVIGLAPVLVRLSETGPAAAGLWRLIFALPLLAVMTRRAEGGLGRPTPMLWLAGAMFAFDLAFWHYGITLTSVANATVLANLTPVVVTIAAWLVFKQAPRRLFVAALALSLGGAWMMAAAKGGTPGKAPALGDALSAATALWYALYFLAVSQARRSMGASKIMFWSTLAGIPLLLLAALVMGEQVLPAGPAGWAACAALGLVHVAGQGSIAWALGRLPAPTASVTVLVQPVVAAGVGWLLFAERLSPWQAAGGAVALAGVVLAQWAGRTKAAASLEKNQTATSSGVAS